MTNKGQKKSGFDFEKSLNELEFIVEKIEKGGLSLEESLQHFEKGVTLTRACQKALNEVEQRVRILVNGENKTSLETFGSEGE